MKYIVTVGFLATSWWCPEIILTAPVCPRSGGVSRNHLDGAAGPRHAMAAAAVGVAAVGCPEIILTARVWPREIILTAQRGPATHPPTLSMPTDACRCLQLAKPSTLSMPSDACRCLQLPKVCIELHATPPPSASKNMAGFRTVQATRRN